MEQVAQNVLDNDLNGLNIKALAPKAIVRLYQDLADFNNIVEAIGKTRQMVLLFPTKANPTQGHWIAILYNKKTQTITHFDPYGFDISQELGYSVNGLVKQNILGQLYKGAIRDGFNVDFNKYQLQELKNGINTCGRWCSMRCRFSYLDNKEFAKLFYKQKMKPDILITLLTFITLKEDETDEEEVIRQAMH